MIHLLLLLFVLLSALEPFDVTGKLLPSDESGPWTTCNVPNGLIPMHNDCKRLLLCYQSTINGTSKFVRRFRHGKVRTNGIGHFDECAKVMEGKEWHGMIIAKVNDGNISFDSSFGIGGILSTEQINTMATKSEINLTKKSEPLIREFENALPFGVFLEDYGLINLLDNLTSCEKFGTKLCKTKCLEQTSHKTAEESASLFQESMPLSQGSSSSTAKAFKFSRVTYPSQMSNASQNAADANDCEGENMVYSLKLNDSRIVHGQKFDCSLKWLLDRYKLSDKHAVKDKIEVKKPGQAKYVFVTAANDIYYQPLRVLITNIKEHFGCKQRIIVYDLGTISKNKQRMKQLNLVCHLEWRIFNYSQMTDDRVRDPHSFSWKVFVIADVLTEQDTVVWLDTSVVFESNNMDKFLEPIQNGTINAVQMPGFSTHGMYMVTHMGMLKFLPMYTMFEPKKVYPFVYTTQFLLKTTPTRPNLKLVLSFYIKLSKRGN